MTKASGLRQLTFDDLLGIGQAGEYVLTHGRRLTFEEAARKIGQQIVMNVSTESHAWYKIVVPLLVTQREGENERRLVCDRGGGKCYLGEFAFLARRSYRGNCLPEYGTEVYET